MIIDSRLTFSDRQAITGESAVTSTNTVDLTNDRNIGPGRAMWVIVQTDAVPSGAQTVELMTSDTEGTGYTAIASVTIPASTPLGSRFVMGMPYSNKRFLRMQYTGAGALSAFLTDQEPVSWQAYPDAV